MTSWDPACRWSMTTVIFSHGSVCMIGRPRFASTTYLC
jgi:hypothetical protein